MRDEHGSGNYGTDARPPGTPEDLQAERDGSTVTLSWTAPGDDWMCGTADELLVLGSANPIDSPSDGRLIRKEDADRSAEQSEQTQLSDAELGDARYVAVMYRDEAGNWGLLASTEVPEAPKVPPSADPPTASGPCANVVPGSAGPDKLNGTVGGDKISGKGGRDKIKGGAGDDCLRGGRGRDRISGGSGDDKIHVRGGRRDRVNCGPGDDTVVASAIDAVNQNCEKVKG